MTRCPRFLPTSSVRVVIVMAVAVGGLLVVSSQPVSAAPSSFTGSLTVPVTTVAAGTPFTVRENATNLTSTSLYPIIIGIRRLGFTVVAAVKPRTGMCRVAGSATCNFVNLAPNETQTYQLTLVGSTPGTYQIQGWANTTSTQFSGGGVEAVTITVT